MTRSYMPEQRLEASARDLLESLNRLILHEASQVAFNRQSNSEQISFSDILDSLDKHQKRGQRRKRGIFAVQFTLATIVTIAAIAISSAVLSLAVISLAVDSGDIRSGDVTPLSNFFVTFLLAALLAMGSATLLAFGAPREGSNHSGKARSPHRSRGEDELAFVKEWRDFEEFMKREIYGGSGGVPVCDLSSIISDFSRIYDLDPEEIRSILRARNAVVHNSRHISSAKVRENLRKLRRLFGKLSLVQESGIDKIGLICKSD